MGRIFLRDRLVVVASPDLAPPKEGANDAWNMVTPKGKARIAVSPVLSLSSMAMVRDAVRAGAGAARLPVSLVSHGIAAGTMVHWGDVEGPEIALWPIIVSGWYCAVAHRVR